MSAESARCDSKAGPAPAPATVPMDAIECLRTRRSVRAYRADPVPDVIVESIIDCGRLAPTAMNVQPWTFVAVRDAAMRARLAEAIGHSTFLAGAPVCVAVCAARAHEFWVEDASAATENLLLAAHAYGLGSCWIAVRRLPYARRVADLLGVPADHEVLALVTLGYPAEHPRVDKKPLAQVLRWERY
jgi:nitroreductase